MKSNILRFPAVSVLTLSLLVVAMPVSGAGTTQIGGVGVFAAECNSESSLYTIVMSGSLVGCWYTDSLVSTITPSGVYQEWGNEHFVGCVNTQCGTFHTSYKFTAKLDTTTFAEIRGRCEHKIVDGGGSGDFAGATGRVDIKDDVANAVFNYRGHITFN